MSTPVRRIVHEHRRTVVVLGVLAVLNVAAVAIGVVPLSSGVRTAETRRAQGAAALGQARRNAEAARTLQSAYDQAKRELQAFYAEVLPHDVAAARRLLQFKLAQVAETHDVALQRSAATPERSKDSRLARLRVVVSLEGDYADVRAFIHDLEQSADFIVIDTLALQEGADASAPLALTLELSTYYVAGEADED